MIGRSADAQDWAIDVVGYGAEVVVHLVADRWVLKKRAALFGRENQVQVDLGEGLGHDSFR